MADNASSRAALRNLGKGLLLAGVIMSPCRVPTCRCHIGRIQQPLSVPVWMLKELVRKPEGMPVDQALPLVVARIIQHIEDVERAGVP